MWISYATYRFFLQVSFSRHFCIISFMKKALATFFVSLFAPISAFASVRVSEIAWMGTAVSSSKEWIELFNDGDYAVDISGYVLSAEGVGKLSISLAGTIASKSFFLLERTSDDTVPGIAADHIYTGTLGNSGETLILEDAAGGEMQRINASAGWQAGDNATKETMQWSNGAWITAAATPKTANAPFEKTPPKLPEEKAPSNSQGDSSPPVSAHGGPLPLSDFIEEPELLISAGRDRIVPADGVLGFEAQVRGGKTEKDGDASFLWLFGDGSSEGGVKVSHAYEYPGNYIVILNAESREVRVSARANVLVFSPDVDLAVKEGGEASFSNRSAYDMNLGGWKLRRRDVVFVFPEDTIVGAKRVIAFSPAVTKFPAGGDGIVELLSPSGKIIARSVPEKMKIIAAGSDADALRGNIQSELSRVAADVELVRTRISGSVSSSTSSITESSKSVQYAAPRRSFEAVSLREEKTASSSEKETPPHIITLKKPEGFFTKLWHFFF